MMNSPSSSTDRVEFATAGDPAEIASWFDEHADPLTASVNRYLATKGRVSFRASDEKLAAHFRLRFEGDRIETAGPSFGGTKPRLQVYSRNDVAWLATRSWSRDTKGADVAALKAAKAACAANVVEDAAAEMTSVLGRMYGNAVPQTAVTVVAPGHSRRSENFAVLLARAVATRLQLPFVKVFGDRFVSGVSHPKEFAKLPPLELIAKPAFPHLLVVDDVSTSGFHMEEAVGRLRAEGYAVQGCVWIGGTVQ